MSTTSGFRDEFLSDEDLDLRNLSEEELIAYWNLWLHQAQRPTSSTRRSSRTASSSGIRRWPTLPRVIDAAADDHFQDRTGCYFSATVGSLP